VNFVIFYNVIPDYPVTLIYRLPSILSNKEEETLQRVVSLLSSTVTYVDRLSEMKYDVTLTVSNIIKDLYNSL
jgi:hypothetical protein